jgi:Nuclease-related domain
LAGYRAARSSRRRRRLFALVLMGAGCFLTLVSLWAALGAFCAGAALWLGAGRSDPQRWLRGAAGELATAAILDTLPSRRWVVLHDLRIPGSRANIDHLAVGPTGAWVVDSKTTRATVTTGFRAVYFGDRRLDVGPLRWEATVVEETLGVKVRPIVAVHAAGLRRRGARAGGVRVVPAESVARRIRRGRRRLGRDDVATLADLAVGRFQPGYSPGKRTATRV